MNTHLRALLILAVTCILLTLIIASTPLWTVLGVVLVLVVLILVICKQAKYLPTTLKHIIAAFTKSR